MRRALILPILALACGHRSDNSFSAPRDPAPAAFVWPQFNDVPPADALVITDAAGDQTLMPEGPPTVVPVPFTDITQVRAWRSGDWLYVRADFAGAFPTEGTPVVQGETILTNGVNLVMDSDHSYDTGAHNLNLVDGVALGVDLLFAMGVYYNHSATPAGAA